MDTIRSAQRSALMSRIKSENTGPEMIVRQMVHRLGFRYRLHRRTLPGAPDLVFPRLRCVVFVHGCFWHQHAGCRRSNMPKTRTDYWGPKLERNVRRDEAASEALVQLGWTVAIVWECETEKPEGLEQKLGAFLSKP